MLLLSASDWPGNIVGYGKHFLCNDKIVQLNGNMFIAKKELDLDRYRGVNDACDVEIAENGDIIIWYRNDPVKKFGCSIDLVTKNEGSIPFQFGVSKSKGLSNCLVKTGNMEGEGGTGNHDATNWNTIPFSFSLKDAEFEKLKSNPQFLSNLVYPNLRVYLIVCKTGNMEGEGGTGNHDATNWNTIPFSFSLKRC
uniref:Uncharacterized protein n=1 Tax=Meloidogyne incognita TaxID=6306 RepID=A0A914M1T1_MELIC